jgi:uncharacterized membrane protein YjjP (DUF1212 family)
MAAHANDDAEADGGSPAGGDILPFALAASQAFHDLEKTADTAIAFGRVLMECGASVKVIEEGARLVVRGLGARPIGLRTGYASLTLTVSAGGHRVTRMRPVGRHAVNHRLDRAVRQLALDVAENGGTHVDVRARLDKLVAETPRYPPTIVAIGTGAACAAFGQLLGMDWAATGPVLAAGSIGQMTRHLLLHRGVNLFIMAAIVAFIAATLGGLGAAVLDSAHVTLAAVASTLLLVPGFPATNAQTDIMDGFPTVGSARAVGVAMLMVFTACGIWCAETVIRAVL